MATLTMHNLDGLSESDFRFVVSENIEVAMRMALGEKTELSKSGKSVIFSQAFRQNGRADLADLTDVAILQADKAGLNYRSVPVDAVNAYREACLASPDAPYWFSGIHQVIDEIFDRAEKARIDSLSDALWRGRVADLRQRQRECEAGLHPEKVLSRTERSGRDCPQLSEIYGHRADDGLIHVRYVKDGLPVFGDNAAEPVQNFVLTENDALAIGIRIK